MQNKVRKVFQLLQDFVKRWHGAGKDGQHSLLLGLGLLVGGGLA
jgi:hypothetical protein